ncbi:helix-turn-helix domain-containing protein [Mycobacterium sp. ITM-2016-00318]|uniref:helix-turn-helix domain-containing protein n=1 Tax=Mycobacterium sp. ITM-2016-00318 TaxID=2099693 RepID=UPI001E2D373C|nr:helix-turn-helix domain-containing protein [Mycobacterium sp. ITM-2016-00318]WNG94475.1 helix-turn-helix domain-containing protein [Mycobacterium sp. ITM-2016-00318]
MTAMTKHDAINAAMGLAEDVAEGRLDPAVLKQQAVTELRALFGTVVGPDDPAWDVQADVARQAIALGALTADELSEWAAVMRRRTGGTLSGSGFDETLRCMREKGNNATDIAKMLGVSRATVYRYLAGNQSLSV